MLAIFLKTEGPWLEAQIDCAGQRLCVMDGITIDQRYAPVEGQEIDVELFATVDEENSWEEIFSGNPERKKCLVLQGGWRYIAFGQIVSIQPLVVDCGILRVPDVIHTSDSRVVGEYVALGISRLDAILCS